MIAEEQRIRRISWFCWSALLIALAWVADRFCRRRQISAPGRFLAFAGVIAAVIGATIGGVLCWSSLAVPPPGEQISSSAAIYWFHAANVLLLFYGAGALCALALLLGSGLFLVRVFRTRNSRQTLTAR